MRIQLPVIAGLLTILSFPAGAEQWPTAMPRIFASREGSFAFKILPSRPPSAKAVGLLFALDDKGNEKVIWRKQLVNTPVRAFVANNGRFVVTTDTWGRAGHEHTLVVYGKQGRIIADFKLDDLLTRIEINVNVNEDRPTAGVSRWWTKRAALSFDGDHDPQHFLIQFQWNKTVKIELPTGKVK